MCDVCLSEWAILFYLVGVASIVSFIVLVVLKNKIAALLAFSVLVNLVFLSAILLGSLFFRIYNVEWLQYVVVFVWPIINVVLVISYARKKK